MRFKERDLLKNISPSKSVYNKPGLQNVVADKGEHEKLLASISRIKEGIETAEKKYKDLINSRKRLEVAESNRGLPSLEPINCDNLIAAAREKLIETKSRTKHQQEDKSNLDRDLNEKLKTLNENAREWYRKRKELSAAGPKFMRHSFSPFGRILLVSPITQNIFSVFTSKNTVEIWEIDVEGPDQKSRIIEVYEIPGQNLTCAIDLYQHEVDNDTLDLLKNIPDHEKYITGMKNTTWVKRKPLAKPKAVPVKQTALEAETSIIEEEEEEEEEDDGSIKIPEQFFRRNSFLKGFNELDALASSKLPSWNNEKELMNWKLYPMADAPKIYFKNMYFCGSTNGSGILVEVLSAYNPVTRKTLTACQVRFQKTLSQSPLKIAFCKSLLDGTLIISTEVTTKSGEHFVVGLDLNLEIEWSCRCDVIRMTMTDKCTRYISKEQQMSIFDEKKESRAPEENLITYFAYDDIYSSLLLGTVSGTVLRLFYQKEKQSKINRLEDRDVPKSGAPLKLVWCLELTGPNVSTKQKSTSDLIDASIEHERPPDDQPIKITSVRQYLNQTLNQTFILVGASDGVVRVFLNDNLKVRPNPSILYTDRFFRNEAKASREGKSFGAGFESDQIHCDCDYIGTNEVNLVVGVTSKNSLIVYDPIEADDTFLEIQILSNVIANGKHAEGEKGCFLKILDPKRGTIVVYHGKYWSVVSLKDMINYRRKATAAPTIYVAPATVDQRNESESNSEGHGEQI